MTLRNFSSSATQTTLSAGVNASATTIAVSATTGFPAAPFIIALDEGAAAQELALVTNVAGLSLTVTRGYDSTVASAHSTGAVVSHSHAALDFREANAHVNATSGAHGVAGSVVGTTDAQTLTNKTLTAPALTDPTATGSLAGFGGAWTAYTPTITAETGALTTVSATGKYRQIGKTVHFSVDVRITTVGTGAGGLRFTLPVPAVSQAFSTIGWGRESGITGKMLVAVIIPGATSGQITDYLNASPIVAGYAPVVTGFYEVP